MDKPSFPVKLGGEYSKYDTWMYKFWAWVNEHTQNLAPGYLLGRYSGTGAPQQVSLGSNLTLGTNGTLTAADQRTTGTATKLWGIYGTGTVKQDIAIGSNLSLSTDGTLSASASGVTGTATKLWGVYGTGTTKEDIAIGQGLALSTSGTLSALNTPVVPQGRLTLVSGTPVMTTDQPAKTTIYYTPYLGDLIPLYDGTKFVNTTFTELSLAMAGSANWAADTLYDLYIYNDAGTLRLVTGAAWSSASARSESLTRINGILTNNATMTGRYGASSTVSIAANRATYVGTFRTVYATDGGTTTGTTTWELGGQASGGDRVALFLWNMYNRVEASGFTASTVASYTYSSSTVRPAGNAGAMFCAFITGLVEDSITLAALMRAGLSTAYGFMFWGISAVNSTTTFLARSLVYAAGGVGVDGQYGLAHVITPILGYQYHMLVEQGDNSSTFTSYPGSFVDNYIAIKVMM